LAFLKTQQSAPKDNIFNITSGKGHSVIEVLNQLSNEGVTFGQPPVQYHFTKARPGDPSHITGDPSLANEVLQWHPRHSDLQTIAISAWKHQLKLNLSIDYSA
jgi:UDP-glucose 4-epimerase